MAQRHALSYAENTPRSQRVHYSLVELPTEILSTLDSSDLSLTIKGQPDDEAVLCTSDRTYAVRASVNSNSLLLCRSTPAADDDSASGIEIVTTLHQTLEVQLTRPRTERIEDLLRDSTWDSEEADAAERPSKRRRRYTHDELHDLVQASDGQIDEALRADRILTIDGHLRQPAPEVLPKLLSSMLVSVALNDLDPAMLNVNELAKNMADEHDMTQDTADNVISWFSSGPPGAAKIDVKEVVGEIGRSLLTQWKPTPGVSKSRANEIPLEEFLAEWKDKVGAIGSKHCDAKLLAGECLYNATPTPHLISVPSRSLPLEPTARFTALFSLRQKWASEEILPGIGANDKERERLLLKNARKVKQGKETIYVSRTAPS